MIDFLDRTLKHLLESRLAVTAGFDAPDNNWRGYVSSTGGDFLNLYLVELRENRKLRSNELVTEWVGSLRQQEMAPARLDCHYLVSAWSPAGVNPTPLVEATIQEDSVLYAAAKVLFDNVPLDLNVLYPSGAPTPPPEMLEQPLPAVVAPPEGFAKLPDFWMRMDWVWKPVLELIVTLPIVAVARPAGPAITTLVTHYLQNGSPASVEELIVIGGVVRTGSPATSVPGAWVRLVEFDRMVKANRAGQFIFGPVSAGRYHLESGAAGHAIATRTVDVPSLSGEYDMVLP